MSVITTGTKRRLECMAPVEAVIGVVGEKKSGNINPSRYGAADKVIGYRRSYGAANRFRVWNGKYVVSAEKRGQVLAHQAKFRAVAQLARLRLMDAQHRQQDEINFKKQTQYGTLFGYVFHEEWLVYED